MITTKSGTSEVIEDVMAENNQSDSQKRSKWPARLHHAAKGAIAGVPIAAAVGVGVVAAAVKKFTRRFSDDIPIAEQKRWENVGIGLMIAFPGAVVGQSVWNNMPPEQYGSVDTSAVSPEQLSLTKSFSIQDLRKDGCTVAFDGNGEARILSGQCSVAPQL